MKPQEEQRPEVPKGDPILPMQVLPGLTPEVFEAATREADVLILFTFASGAFPTRLVPVVEQRIGEGKAVISLTSNPRDEAGFRGIRYAAGEGAYHAGMRGLERVNIRDFDTVYEAVTNAYGEGLRGQALADHIAEQFSFKGEEEFPPAEWDTAEGVDSMRKSMRTFFGRLGYTGDDLERELHVWEFGESDPPSPTSNNL